MTNDIGLHTTVNNTSSFYYVNDDQLMDLADKHKVPVAQLCIWADRATKPDGSTAPLEEGDIIVIKTKQEEEAKAKERDEADKKARDEAEAKAKANEKENYRVGGWNVIEGTGAIAAGATIGACMAKGGAAGSIGGVAGAFIGAGVGLVVGGIIIGTHWLFNLANRD